MARLCALTCLALFGASLIPPALGYDLNQLSASAPIDRDDLEPTLDDLTSEQSASPVEHVAASRSGQLFAAQ